MCGVGLWDLGIVVKADTLFSLGTFLFLDSNVVAEYFCFLKRRQSHTVCYICTLQMISYQRGYCMIILKCSFSVCLMSPGRRYTKLFSFEYQSTLTRRSTFQLDDVVAVEVTGGSMIGFISGKKVTYLPDLNSPVHDINICSFITFLLIQASQFSTREGRLPDTKQATHFFDIFISFTYVSEVSFASTTSYILKIKAASVSNHNRSWDEKVLPQVSTATYQSRLGNSL